MDRPRESCLAVAILLIWCCCCRLIWLWKRVCGLRAGTGLRLAPPQVLAQGGRQPLSPIVGRFLLSRLSRGLAFITIHATRATSLAGCSQAGLVSTRGAVASCAPHSSSQAVVAQGQSTSLVRTGSVVQFHSTAPFPHQAPSLMQACQPRCMRERACTPKSDGFATLR